MRASAQCFTGDFVSFFRYTSFCAARSIYLVERKKFHEIKIFAYFRNTLFCADSKYITYSILNNSLR